MKTLKELKATKTIRATRLYTGQYHADNHDEFIAYLRECCEKRNPGVVFDLHINDGKVYYVENNIPTTMFWFLPKIKKQQQGVVEFRSQDYRFLADGASEHNHGIILRAENLREYGFAVKYIDNVELQYHLEKGE